MSGQRLSMIDALNAKRDEQGRPHAPECSDEGCTCSDDVFWGRLLGDGDPCVPGKDWAAAAFGEGVEDD